MTLAAEEMQPEATQLERINMKAQHASLTAKPKKRRITFKLKGTGARAVFLAGSFNGWDPTMTEMRPVNGKDEWRRQVHLEPGLHEYLFASTGSGRPIPRRTDTRPTPSAERTPSGKSERAAVQKTSARRPATLRTRRAMPESVFSGR